MTTSLFPKCALLATCVLTVSVVFVPLSAHAQSQGYGSTLSGAAVAIIGCNSKGIGNGLKRIFGGDSSSKKSVSPSGVGSGANAVPVSDATVTQNTTDTKTATEATSKKLRCENALAKAAAQTAIRTITQKTVNWINTGFNGQPVFVQDQNSFLKQIVDTSVLNFTKSLSSDQTKYPFGRTTAQSLTREYTASFEDRSKYTLDQTVGKAFPGATAKDYTNDFAVGGWDTFLASMESNNDPYGFYLFAGTELQNKVANNAKVAQTQSELDRSGGFLDLKKCVQRSGNDCYKWETQTPGIVVADQLKTVLGSPVRQLENGQDLNASLTQIFDQLLDSLLKKGLSQIR